MLTYEQALNALGMTVEVTPGTPTITGQPRVQARAVRDDTVVAVTLRDSEGDAVEALYRSVTQPPARRTRTRR